MHLRDAPPPPRRMRIRLGAGQVAALLALLAVGVAAAAGAALMWREGEATRDRDWAERTATALEQEVHEGGIALLGARGLYEGSTRVTEAEFRRYATAPLARTGMVGLAWMPRVPDARRAAWERAHGVRVLDARTEAPRGSADFHPSPARPVHYPFLYIAEARGAPAVLGLPGLDGLGHPGQATALAAARRTGQPALARLTPTAVGTMVVLYASVDPVGPAARRGAPARGFVAAAFMLDDLVAPVVAGLPEGTTVQLAEDGRRMYGPAGTSGAPVSVQVAGRRWAVRVDAPATGAGGAAPAGILVASLLITAVVGLLFAQGNRREDESRRATAEQAALRRVATAAASSPEDVVSLVAAEAAQLLGADGGVVCRFADGHAGAVGAWGALGIGELPGPIGLRGRGALAGVARTGRPVRIDDYRTLSPEDPVAVSGWARAVGTAVAAPVRVGDRLWGAVLVARVERRPFPPDTEERLGRFADLAAAAISSAEARRELALQATTDPLTGLANRRTFEARLEAELARAERTGGRFAVALLDIDHFKRVNDEFGHAAGDGVLVEVARRLGAAARPQDLVARIGGEEIAWIMTETGAAGAVEAAERARRIVRATPFAGVGTVTLSAGVCDVDGIPQSGGLMRGADLALYWAKAHGRDMTACHRPDGTIGPLPDRAGSPAV